MRISATLLFAAAVIASAGEPGKGSAASLAPSRGQIGDSRSVQVRFNDLDLASLAGQLALQRRVRQASRQVCGFESGQKGSVRAPFSDCVHAAQTVARPQIESAIMRSRRAAMNDSSTTAVTPITVFAR